MPFLGDDIGRDICDVDLLPAHQHGRDVVVVIVVVVHHLNIVILNNGDTQIRLDSGEWLTNLEGYSECLSRRQTSIPRITLSDGHSQL